MRPGIRFPRTEWARRCLYGTSRRSGEKWVPMCQCSIFQGLTYRCVSISNCGHIRLLFSREEDTTWYTWVLDSMWHHLLCRPSWMLPYRKTMLFNRQISIYWPYFHRWKYSVFSQSEQTSDQIWLVSNRNGCRTVHMYSAQNVVGAQHVSRAFSHGVCHVFTVRKVSWTLPGGF